MKEGSKQGRKYREGKTFSIIMRKETFEAHSLEHSRRLRTVHAIIW
jgi:hypothetical protein